MLVVVSRAGQVPWGAALSFGSLRSALELLKSPMCHAPSKYLPAGPFACGGQNAFVARSAPSYYPGTNVGTNIGVKIPCKLD